MTNKIPLRRPTKTKTFNHKRYSLSNEYFNKHDAIKNATKERKKGYNNVKIIKTISSDSVDTGSDSWCIYIRSKTGVRKPRKKSVRSKEHFVKGYDWKFTHSGNRRRRKD